MLFDIVQQFKAILEEVKHYMSTVGDTTTVINLAGSMNELASHISASLKEGVFRNVAASSVNSALHKAKAWHTSAERFVERLRKEYPPYCDLLGPFVAGVSQVRLWAE